MITEADIKEQLYTESGLLIAIGFVRIVYGKRGPYIEFDTDQLIHKNLRIPPDCGFRLTNEDCYYNEYRTIDKSYVKVYHQKKTVEYADYKVNMWYISPNDLNSKRQKFIEMFSDVP